MQENAETAISTTLAIAHASDIVSAYVSKNAISATDLPKLLVDVHNTIVGLATPAAAVEAPTEASPAVPIRKSVTPDFIFCLNCGLKHKSLKRHLRTAHNLTPEGYRELWKLPSDFPMVAPLYAETRSRLAKENGLGRKA